MTGTDGPCRVRVSVPATTANLGAGFDALGAALALRGEVALSQVQSPPSALDRGQAMALEAAEAVFARLGRALPPIHIDLESEIPVARGLGASAMVRAGAAVAAAVLAGAEPQGDWLLEIVTDLEHHADNAAPALLGGLQAVVWHDGTVEHARVPMPGGVRAVLFVPEFEMPTDESRKLLPQTLSRADAVHNISRAALLVAAMASGRLELLRTATDDRLHQPARAALFPAMYDLFEAAMASGADCAYLSGGGSSILAVTQRHENEIGAALLAAAAAHGVGGSLLITEFSERGAEIVEAE